VLKKLGIDPSRIVGMLPPDWLHFVKALNERAGCKLSSLFEHGLNMGIPSVESSFFGVMAKNIAQEIVEQTDSMDTRLMVMPAGGFAKALAKNLSASGVTVVGFIDNYKWKFAKDVDGTPLIRPEDTGSFNFEKILLATPSYKAQTEMNAQLSQILGPRAIERTLLFGDLFLESQLKEA
jgi:hypothetical protein